MWQINGEDIKEYYGMEILNNQIHKLLVSNKLNFDINSEFDESHYEQWWRVYPYGISFSKNEPASIDVLFRNTASNSVTENIKYFHERMSSFNFQKTLENQDFGIKTDIIYKGFSNIIEYKNSISCTLDLYVSNLYEGTFSNASDTFFTNNPELSAIKINETNTNKFNCLSLKGNYKELTDINKTKMNSIAKDLVGVNYPLLRTNKKDASLKFVLRSDTIQSVIKLFNNFIYFCKTQIPTQNNVLKLEHSEVSDKMPAFEIYGVFTQFTPTYLNCNNGKVWLEFTGTFRMVDIYAEKYNPFPYI